MSVPEQNKNDSNLSSQLVAQYKNETEVATLNLVKELNKDMSPISLLLEQQSLKYTSAKNAIKKDENHSHNNKVIWGSKKDGLKVIIYSKSITRKNTGEQNVNTAIRSPNTASTSQSSTSQSNTSNTSQAKSSLDSSDNRRSFEFPGKSWKKEMIRRLNKTS